MKISSFKNLIALNVLSSLGYLSFLVTSTFFVRVAPVIRKLDNTTPDVGMAYGYTWIHYLLGFYCFSMIAFLLLVILAVVETKLKNKGKTLKIDTSKLSPALITLHPYIFWLGIFFVFIPLYWLVAIYGFNVIFDLLH